MITSISSMMRHVVAAARNVLRVAVSALGRLWRRHTALLKDGSAYAAVLVAAAGAVVSQADLADLIVAVLAAVVAVYRLLHAGPDGSGGIAWRAA